MRVADETLYARCETRSEARRPVVGAVRPGDHLASVEVVDECAVLVADNGAAEWWDVHGAVGAVAGGDEGVAMRLLVSGTTRTVSSLSRRWVDRLGHLITPSNRNSMASLLSTGLPWAADNGCYSGFEPQLFRGFLRKIAGHPGCLFAVVPDVVGDARATLDLFGEWCLEVRATGQPIAFVGQDGAEDLPIPWNDFDAWFIGGSTRWKLSAASAGLAHEAIRQGKWLHMGRVNSRKRMTSAASFGCDSIDGSSASMFGDRNVPRYCAWLEQITRQGVLFGDVQHESRR